MAVRAGGKIDGARYAGSSYYAPIVPPGPTKLRIAGGKIAGVRYAGLGFGATENPADTLSWVSTADVSSITSDGFDVTAEVSVNGTAMIVVTAHDADQPDDSEFDASVEQQSVTGGVPFTIEHSGETGGDFRRAWLQVKAGAQRVTSSDLALVPHDGFLQVLITDASNPAKLQFDPPIALNEIVSWGNVIGTGTVVVDDEATWDADYRVSSFETYVGNYTDGWRAFDTQYVTDVLNALFCANSL